MDANSLNGNDGSMVYDHHNPHNSYILIHFNGRDHIVTSHRFMVEHIVKTGDTLWGISKRYLGNGQLWEQIYEDNKGIIGKNPNLIYPGQRLQINA
jgi:nucleoid-associated protein YgaU